ncbi:3D domain-containing protein [Candidatus Enterococcus mansonii]|uniref:3D domain-containing protein n=1 Tax=Candidatus Enterococcus mansonii TaxID=1834181 RepID=A0A242C5U6_9ENTE|nr:3D domain-containing protein [Enterococcus sp. 4G2_DIV0659]OTO05556.1 hypothetical protein A5880_002729 [Enterococcus sp. 4G2_DIV0659]
MKRRWLPMLFIVACFIMGSVIPVYAAENKSSHLESLKNYTVLSEGKVKELSNSMVKLLAQGQAIRAVKADILNKEKQTKIKEAEKKDVQEQPVKHVTPTGQKMMMEATAYSCNEGIIGGGNMTAMGQDLQVNPMAIAVDPTVIPLGTKLFVEGYGEAVASDTGGAIKGNIIDLHFADVSRCIEWGRRQVEVTILV